MINRIEPPTLALEIRLRRLFRRVLPGGFYSNLFNIPAFFKSRKIDPELAKGDVACILCTWDEKRMIKLALQSSKDFVTRYIVVDKNGSTVPIIKECVDEWGLDMEIFVKPMMTLRESRAYALEHISEPWVLIQDGDEVYHTNGPTNIQVLRDLMIRSDVVYCASAPVLTGDFYHIHPRHSSLLPHPFLYHNNGTLRAPDLKRDHLTMDGWKILLPETYKFNCVIKSPKRLFLRRFWNECFSGPHAGIFYDLEDYVVNYRGIDLDVEVDKWYSTFLENYVLYDEAVWGKYPELIRKEINQNGCGTKNL